PTRGEANIGEGVLGPVQSPHVAAPLLKDSGVAESMARGVIRFEGRRAALDEARLTLSEMEAHLLLELGGVARAKEQVSDAPSELAQTDGQTSPRHRLRPGSEFGRWRPTPAGRRTSRPRAACGRRR